MRVVGPVTEGSVDAAGGIYDGFCDVVFAGCQQVQGGGGHLHPQHGEMESKGSAVGDDVESLHSVGDAGGSLKIAAQDFLNLLVLTA